jgi:GH24 family phage-related lysozyme (muramidase)/uncharacterized membrane protein
MKKPQATKNAKKVALKSYSMWANYLGLVALIAPEVIYWMWTIDTNPRLWWFIGVVLIVLGSIGRLINQNISNSPFAVTLLASFLAMSYLPNFSPPQQTSSGNYTQQEFLDVALPLVAKWEGLKTEAYQDIVGVWTVCYGETKGVQPGDTYTKAECRDMLAREVVSYQQGWHGYLTEETLSQRLHAERDAAYTSLAYNVGIAGAGKSTATRRLNNGDIAGGCEALTWWNKAGDRVVRGLVRRRQDEYNLCMKGLT